MLNLPFISINLQYFVDLGSLPFPTMLWRLFADGGWIPMVFVLGKGFARLWLLERQNLYASTFTFTLLAVNVPRLNEQAPKAAEHIFSHISGAYSRLDIYEKYWAGKFQPTFSFEIASFGGFIQFFIRIQTKYRDLVEASIYAQYPDAEIVEVTDYVNRLPREWPNKEFILFGGEFVLKKPPHLPLRTYMEFEHTASEDYFKDPMANLLEMLGGLKPSEQFMLQFLVSPSDDKWKEAGEVELNKLIGRKVKKKPTMVDHAVDIPMHVLKEVGGAFLKGGSSEKKPEKKEENPFKMLNMTPGERTVLEAIQTKLSKTGLKVKLRFLYLAPPTVFSTARFSSLKGVLSQYGNQASNGFRPHVPSLPKIDYFWQRWLVPRKSRRVVRYFCNRSNKGASPFVLSIEELATLYHFPMSQLKAPLVKKTDAKRGEPPAALPTRESLLQSPFQRVGKTPAPPSVDESDDDDDGPPKNLPVA